MPERRFRLRHLLHPGVGAGLAAVALLALLPVAAPQWVGFGLGALVLVALATSYDVLGGFAGYLNLGHASFFGLGGYAFAIAVAADWPIPLAGVAAVVVPVVVALAVGPALLRLHGVYFAIAAFGLVVLFDLLAFNLRGLTGGAAGLALVTAVPQTAVYLGALAVSAVSVLVTFVLSRSRFGLGLEAIREDEEVAVAFGVPAARLKLAALALSAALAGATGALYVLDVFFIGPETVFGLSIALTPVIAALVGGSGLVGGPLLGAVVLFTVQEQLRDLVGELSLLFYGVVLMLTGLLMPGGALRLVASRRPAARRAAPVGETAAAQAPR